MAQGRKLSGDWARQIFKQVGNYGEVFERKLGKGSPLGIERGLKCPKDSGLQYDGGGPGWTREQGGCV